MAKAKTSENARGERRLFLERAFLTAAVASGAGILSGFVSVARAAFTPPSVACSKVPTPMREVKGKVAFITGGSSGVGLGIARAFADVGMKVVIGYRTQSHLDEAMRALDPVRDQIHAISVDVTDRSGMERAADETVKIFGKVHVLVNNAGVGTMAPLDKTTYDDWDWVMSVNVTGVFNGVRAFLPHIQAHAEGGQIIAASSSLGLYCAEGAGVYNVSKFAVLGMMEGLRADLAHTNIGVSVYCPGSVSSNIGDSDRNRPGNLANAGVPADAKTKAAIKAILDNPELVISSLEFGRLVLRGMRNNDLYILTHPEYEPMVRARNDALVGSFPADLPATQARIEAVRVQMEKSIYVSERDRKGCARV